MSQKNKSARIRDVKGQWNVTVKSCGALNSVNVLNITGETDDGGMTGSVGASFQGGGMNAANEITFQVEINGTPYTFSGTYYPATPDTAPYMKGSVTNCPDGEDGTWSATAQTGTPDPTH